MIHVVDTHALTRYFEDLDLLGADGRAVMTHPNSDLVVPAIVMAEARWMIEKRRARVEMHDAIICATALLVRDSLREEVRLITRDKDIRDSGLIETVW